MSLTETSARFRDFAARLLEHEGALVERIEPAGLEGMLPAPLQQALGAPEFVRLGFAAELPPQAQRVSLESDWLERFGRLLDGRGLRLKAVVNAPVPAPSNPERMLEHGLVLQNAVHRLARVTPAWTRYLILIFRYTAISDEKREGVIRLGINLASGSAIDPFADTLLAAVIHEDSAAGATLPPDVQLPPDWTEARLKTFVARALPARVRAHLGQFLNGMQRRLDRDLVRVHEYYSGLRDEALRKLKRQKADSARERLRIESAEREYQVKVADLRQKYDLRVTVELGQTLELVCPVERLEVIVRRRKGERRIALDWNPLARQLEPPPCEWNFATDAVRVVCDDALHLTSPAGHNPCGHCGKEYCRACHPHRCPRCGRA
ncbi:MAG TPA: hypothetical protein VFD58_37330 [Blastocatellia bacterium]|nr:hypothetical protein [Blastocatellia bacterium]